MKTSFYFVLWIAIYPILGLLHNSFVDNNAFLIALAIVWGLSVLLNRAMPNTLLYERVSESLPVLEDVYNGNVAAFMKKLKKEALVGGLTAAYLCVAVIVIAIAMLAGANDWVAFIIFALLAYGGVVRSIGLIKGYIKLRSNPSPDESAKIVDNAFKCDYSAYYEERERRPYQYMFPPRPKHFKTFQVFSLVVAVIAAILGLVYIIMAVGIATAHSSVEADSVAIMYFLYGSLAAYFGVTDSFSIADHMKRSIDDR